MTIRVLGKTDKVNEAKKVEIKNLRIMSKQYAHLHAMAKTSVKFQNDWPKTVGGVAFTSQLLTNGQTDERMGHGTPISHLRANAGVTKSQSERKKDYIKNIITFHANCLHFGEKKTNSKTSVCQLLNLPREC